MRYLGVDYGEKRIGLAIGDDESRIASPYKVLEGTEDTEGTKVIEELGGIVAAEGIGALVVGVPMKTGGHHSSEQLDRTRAFIAQLKQHVDVPVYEIDERHTTAEAQRLIDERGAEAPVDALAAMVLLQEYFDEE